MDVFQKAKGLLSSGQLEESRQLFTHFIDSHSESSEHQSAVTDAYNSRGHIKYLAVDFPGAIADYSQAIERDPSFTIAWYNRGQVQYRLGRYQKAEHDLSRALELEPDFRDAQLNLAQVKRDLAAGHRFNTTDSDIILSNPP